MYGSNEAESWTTLLDDESNPINSARKTSNTFFLYSLSEPQAFKTYKLQLKKKTVSSELRIGYFNIVNVLLSDYTSVTMKKLVGFQSFMPSVIKPTKGAMIGVITDTSPNYTLKLYVTALGVRNSGYASILSLTKHLSTTETSWPRYADDRLPGIFFTPNSMNEFVFAHSVTGEDQASKRFYMNDTTAEFLMEVVALGDHVTWKIENVAVQTLDIPLAKRIMPEKLYAFAGTNYYAAANVILRNIVYIPLTV